MILKKCPWRESSPILRKELRWSENGRGYYDCHIYYVKCLSCGACVPHGKYHDINMLRIKATENACTTWNEWSKNGS